MFELGCLQYGSFCTGYINIFGNVMTDVEFYSEAGENESQCLAETNELNINKMSSILMKKQI